MKLNTFNYKPNGGRKQKVLAILALWLSFASLSAQDKKTHWVDSVIQTLDVKEKVGQLFILPVSAYSSTSELDNLLRDIRDYRPGGVVITGGGPEGTVRLLNNLQKVSSVPLLVMMDAERGPGTTLDSLNTFPPMLNLGAITRDSLVFEFAKEVGRQMKLLGVHMNLAPNADIEVTAGNPQRYLGSDKHRVASRAATYVNGLRRMGILSSATHHKTEGLADEPLDTDKIIDLTNQRLDTTSLFPFKQLIDLNVDAMMTSHMHFSVLDKKKPIPASVSRIFMTEVLKTKMGFKGLAIAEIPYVEQYADKSNNESEKFAFELGHDLLMNPDNIKGAIKKIENLVRKNAALRQQLDVSVRKILAAKFDAGLSRTIENNPDNITERINSSEATQLEFRLAEESISLINNENNLIPIQNLEDKRFASLSIGRGNAVDFESLLGKYTRFENYSITNAADTSQLMNKLKGYNSVIISLYTLEPSDRGWIIEWINQLNSSQSIIVCSMGNPYDIQELHSVPVLLMGFGDQYPIPTLMAQVIFGTRQAGGQLPLQINSWLTLGSGNTNNKSDRLGYGVPDEVGMSSNILLGINRIVQLAIDSGATPGCHIMVARKGKVIYDRSIGWQTYEKINPVTPETIYDLASITKVAATLQTVMFMHDKSLIDINKKASYYLPELKLSNKKDFTIKDILTHQAGLWPYLPFWQQTMKDSTLLPEYYSQVQNENFPFPVAKDLFVTSTMRDSLWQWIMDARIREKKPRKPYDYTYSDMGFYILQHLAEKVLNQPMEDFLAQNFYEPLGAITTGFLPLARFPESQIAPTEIDQQFRMQPLTGYVHDQGAAMHGGVAGHAGLFSNANDLIKLGQMWLQKGSYGGMRYFKPETIDLFTSKQYENNRRGLGWDKPTLSDWNGPTSLYASPKTFGHTGFTGTAIWVDPEFDLVFVFLSNRVYPDMFNTKLLSGNIRPRIQEVIYQSIFEYCKFRNQADIETY